MGFIKSEIRKIIKNCIIVIVVSVIVLLIIASGISDNYVLYRNIDIWTTMNQYWGLVYVLLAVAPVAWVMVYERKNHYLMYTIPRVNKKKYIISKWLINALSSAIIIFSISFITLLVISYLFPEVKIEAPLSDDTARTHYFRGDIYVASPLLYGFVLSLWRGLLGFLYSTFAFVLSLYNKNLLIVTALPFLFDLFDSFILGTLGLSKYEIMTSFDPSRVLGSNVAVLTFVIGGLTIISGTLITFIYYKIILHEEIYEV